MGRAWQGRTSRLLAALVVVVASVVASVGVHGGSPVGALGCPSYPSGSSQVVQALGDSYSSGEGLNCYLPGSATSSDTCHRSAYAYSAYVAPGVYHGFFACSGALTANVLASWKNGEQPQVLDVSPSASVVTMTIGGNDVDFPKVVTACMSSVISGVTYFHPAGASIGGRDCAGWLAGTASKIGIGLGRGIEPRLVATYRRVLAQMGPHAKLIVGTYPRIFPQPGTYAGSTDFGGQFCVAATVPSTKLGFTSSDESTMYSLQNAMNQQIANAINDVRTNYGDTRIRLADIVAAAPNNTVSCGDSGRATPYVNGVVLALGAATTALLSCITTRNCPGGYEHLLDAANSTASFHPNTTGQHALGTVFNAQVAGPVPLSILNPTPPALPVHLAASLQLVGVGGAGSYTWSLSSGRLPAGLALQPTTGKIVGTPTTTGTETFTVRLAAGTATATRQLTLSVGTTVSTTVPATANPWGAGRATPPEPGGWGPGSAPPSVAVPMGTRWIEVSATGSIVSGSVVGGATPPNGPDGLSGFSPQFVAPAGGVSGLNEGTWSPLVGVFTDGKSQPPKPPATLDFRSAGLGMNFTILSSALWQTFFIGDGRSSAGVSQRFLAPSGATRLYIAIPDCILSTGIGTACSVGGYGDNVGAFNVKVTAV
jgi:hypothetical protein